MTATRSRPGRRLDPRFQARRRKVARSQGRRRLSIVAGLTMVATLVMAAIGLNNSSWLDIDEIQVVGAQRADTRHIVTASGLAPGQPLAELDFSATVAAVEAVPWVASAAVVRNWDGIVVIEVAERIGVAAIPAGGRFAMVDIEGRQLELVAERPEGFMVIDGIEASGVPGDPVEPSAQAAVLAIEQLSPAIAEQTERIVVEDGQVFLVLTVGGRANLGDDRDIENKMIALETVLTRVDLTCIDTIDVRVATAPTVRRLAPGAAGQEPLSDTGGC